MRVERSTDAASFLQQVEPFLLRDEARHNLMLGIAGSMRDGRSLLPEALFWIARDDGEVVGAAQWTPPYNVVVARPRTAAALPALAAAIDGVPGVVAATPEVDAFAQHWCATRGYTSRVDFRQGVYALERVQPIAAAAGAMRRAGEADRRLLLDWIRAFRHEVLPDESAGGEGDRRIVDQRLADVHGGFFLWEDGSEIVSLAGAGSTTPNGIRVGPVYTPPELRGRGYATSLVAKLSQRLLADGRRFCFLYTDLANPTSNAIYERIGYTRVCESRQLAFDLRRGRPLGR